MVMAITVVMTRDELNNVVAEIKACLDKGTDAALDRVLVLVDTLPLNQSHVADRARNARMRILSERASVKQAPLPGIVKASTRPAPAIKGSSVNLQPQGRAMHYFTVEDAQGHITFRVERQGKDAAFAPGEVIISRLVGPNNTKDYKGVAFAKPDGKVIVWAKHRGDTRLVEALEVLAGDPKAAGKAYAKASGNCYRCNHPLTTPESIEAGIGPVCAEKE